MSWLVRAVAAAGFVDEAQDAMRDVGAAAPACGLFATDWVLAEAAVLAAQGHARSAAERALDGARQAASSGMWGAASVAAFDAVRYGGGQPAAEIMIGAVERVDGPLPLAMGGAGAAIVGRDGVALDSASAALADLGALLYAADVANLAADAHRRAGDRRAAMGSVLRSRELQRRCEGAWRPWAMTSPRHEALTEREQEVAILAASGHSDADLAEEMSISIRTVQSHLSRIYAKLDIRGRRCLSEALLESWPDR